MSFEAVINFSFKLLPLINGEKESVIFSPASILSGLSMILAGAKGLTAEQIIGILGKENSKEQVIKYYSDCMKKHASKNGTKRDGEVEVIYGNRLFVSKKVFMIPEFLDVINEAFDGQIAQINYENINEAAKEINTFVDKITNGKIPEMTAPNKIKPETILTIVNVLYFSGKWENVFEECFKLPFYGYSSTREIDVACQRIYDERWNFTEGNDWECLGIPYKNYKAWMYIVLPKEKNGLPNLIKKLNFKLFLEFTKPNNSGHMRIVIPIFEISSKIILNDLLQKFGMTEAFGNNCDLSGMMKNRGKIDEIIHKVNIKVDENGTEASAATMAKCMPCSGRRLYTADHPFLQDFLYFITTENQKKDIHEILFVGTFV